MTGDGDVVRARMGGPVRRVAHGRWSLEVRGDEVADIAFDGVALLRAVRPVVRDRDWNTVPVRVLGQEPDGATLTTELLFEDDGIRYAGAVVLRLRDDEIVVDFIGRALSGFERNRIGLVVLHPAADAGRAVRVRHTDGSATDGAWPAEISPHQPFRDVAGFEWEKDGVAAVLSFSGDVFETEDQRNWTDASFKTYSTPLDLPFPVPVPEGAECRQSVRLTVTGTGRSAGSVARDAVTVGSAVVGTVPPLSLGAALYPPPGSLAGIAPSFETVLVELTGNEDRWPELLHAAAAQAGQLGARLDVRIVAADAAAVRRGVALLAGLPVARLGAFGPGSHITTVELWKALQDVGFAGELVGGTRAHFTELNRQIQRIPADVPVLAFSLTPQMHATEIPHIVDSLAMQRTVAENALRLAAGRPVLVGPVTLARRFNAVATTAAPDPAVAAARAVDPLQATGFAAAWTLGSVASLAGAGVAGICYFETGGPRGVVTVDGALTPAGRLLNTVAGLRGRPVLECVAPEGVAALAVAGDGGAVEVLVADLSGTARTVTVDGPGGRVPVELDAWSVGRAALGS